MRRDIAGFRGPASGSGGSSSSRIAMAVLVGAAFGAIVGLWQLQAHAPPPAVRSLVSSLRTSHASIARLKHRLSLLQKQTSDARSQLRAAELGLVTRDGGTGTGASSSAVLAIQSAASHWSGFRPKAGPPGTVHGQRTNVEIIPDPSVNPPLAAVLQRVAINKELIVGISNINIRGMLVTWFSQIKRAGISNYMVVALDDATVELCKMHDVPVYRREAHIADTQRGTGDNHAISSSKFHILRDFLLLGYAVLLSDIDIGFIKNPFTGGYLHRDCDVEGMTDGFSNDTAYGWDDIAEDPTMGYGHSTHSMRIFVMNSGLFYIRPTLPSVDLLDRVAGRLAREKAWDQAVYNEEMFFPSSPTREGLHISKRVMDFYDFMNSKTLFVKVRKDPVMRARLPVSVHVNYHPEKEQRLVALLKFYVDGDKNALKPFPDGSF